MTIEPKPKNSIEDRYRRAKNEAKNGEKKTESSAILFLLGLAMCRILSGIAIFHWIWRCMVLARSQKRYWYVLLIPRKWWWRCIHRWTMFNVILIIGYLSCFDFRFIIETKNDFPKTLWLVLIIRWYRWYRWHTQYGFRWHIRIQNENRTVSFLCWKSMRFGRARMCE